MEFNLILASSKLGGIPLPMELTDGTLYSFFKYTIGKKNIFICKLMLLLKCHLRDIITIASDDLDDCLSLDWQYAINSIYDKKRERSVIHIRDESIKAPKLISYYI